MSGCGLEENRDTEESHPGPGQWDVKAGAGWEETHLGLPAPAALLPLWFSLTRNLDPLCVLSEGLTLTVRWRFNLFKLLSSRRWLGLCLF